jgi:cytochrome c oxidase assembly protein subunit 15
VNVASTGSTLLKRLAAADLVANILIVVTGGAVRLTGSGLGCPTWPRCSDKSYVVHGALGIHGAIEFGNRTLTFVLAVIAIACFVMALRSGDKLATRLSAIIALGIPAQAVIGGITVLTDLNPWIVAFHLLVSMAMIGVCVWLVDAVRRPAVWSQPAAAGTDSLRIGPKPQGTALRLAWLVFAAGWVVLYLGTIVTGSGPHSGDLDSRRTGLNPQVMSHVHASAVYVLVALTIALLALAKRARLEPVTQAAAVLLVVELVQGAVGLTQYFFGLPGGLVAVHMLGAALTSASLTWVVLRARATRQPARQVTRTGTTRPA